MSYVHVDLAKRDKLDAKAKKCIFIVLGTNFFGYQFQDEENHKIITSGDVTFKGNELYKERSRSNVSEVRKVVVEHTKNPEDNGIEGDVTQEDNTVDDMVGDQEEESDSQTPELSRST